MSEGEELLLQQIRDARLPAPVREYTFAKPRRWRFDFAWPDLKVACEVDGGTFLPKGYHSRGTGFEKDVEKHNTANLMGWLVVRVTPHMINDLRALEFVRRALVVRAQ